jgi:hypothetical protein
VDLPNDMIVDPKAQNNQPKKVCPSDNLCLRTSINIILIGSKTAREEKDQSSVEQQRQNLS